MCSGDIAHKSRDSATRHGVEYAAETDLTEAGVDFDMCAAVIVMDSRIIRRIGNVRECV